MLQLYPKRREASFSRTMVPESTFTLLLASIFCTYFMCCFIILLVGSFLICWLLMIVSKIICWNCKGISGLDTSTGVFYLIKKHNPLLLCLVKTRTDSTRVDEFTAKLPHGLEWATVLAEVYS